MKPGEIRYRGHPIEHLIGNVSFAQMIWLMLRGDLPGPGQGELLDAALMAAVDHGPQAPSIAIARMAATCGVGLNNAMASAGTCWATCTAAPASRRWSCIRTWRSARMPAPRAERPCAAALQAYRELRGKFVSGFGHRFHPLDPRAPRPAGAGGSGGRRRNT